MWVLPSRLGALYTGKPSPGATGGGTAADRPLALSNCACNAVILDMFKNSIHHKFRNELEQSLQLRARPTLRIQFLRGLARGGSLGIGAAVTKVNRSAVQ